MTEQETEALKIGAALMYEALEAVSLLHDAEPMDSDISDEPIDGCKHCSAIADAIVHFPCPTMQILLQDYEPEEEETPAE
jgi:hypothetical protein